MSFDRNSINENYIVLRGGSDLNIELVEKDFNTAWNLTVLYIRKHFYFGKSFKVVLTKEFTLPQDGSDIYQIIPPSEAYNIIDRYYRDSYVDSSTPEGLEKALRTIVIEEDLNNLTSWIINFHYDRISKKVVVTNDGGYLGSVCLVLYELSGDYFDISFLREAELSIFMKYYFGLLDTILGYKRRKYGNSDGDALVSDGKEAMTSCDEDVAGFGLVPYVLKI